MTADKSRTTPAYLNASSGLICWSWWILHEAGCLETLLTLLQIMWSICLTSRLWKPCLKPVTENKMMNSFFLINFCEEETYWMYFRETFWLCLVVMVRMYICSAANRSAASYFSSGPNRSMTTSLQLYNEEDTKLHIFLGLWNESHVSVEQR